MSETEETTIQQDMDRYATVDLEERMLILRRFAADTGLSVLQILDIVDVPDDFRLTKPTR